jgi:hypothetical protein
MKLDIETQDALEIIIDAAREEALKQKYEEMFDKYYEILYAINTVEDLLQITYDEFQNPITN